MLLTIDQKSRKSFWLQRNEVQQNQKKNKTNSNNNTPHSAHSWMWMSLLVCAVCVCVYEKYDKYRTNRPCTNQQKHTVSYRFSYCISIHIRTPFLWFKPFYSLHIRYIGYVLCMVYGLWHMVYEYGKANSFRCIKVEMTPIETLIIPPIGFHHQLISMNNWIASFHFVTCVQSGQSDRMFARCSTIYIYISTSTSTSLHRLIAQRPCCRYIHVATHNDMNP